MPHAGDHGASSTTRVSATAIAADSLTPLRVDLRDDFVQPVGHDVDRRSGLVPELREHESLAVGSDVERTGVAVRDVRVSPEQIDRGRGGTPLTRDRFLPSFAYRRR